MRPLSAVAATAEQLKIFSRIRSGVEVIRGAAGSGKTTTAILKLQANIAATLRRRARDESKRPVRVLVLTFNRTLRGYVEALVRQQVAQSGEVELDVMTFAKWAQSILNNPQMLDGDECNRKLRSLGAGLDLGDYLVEEAEYVAGRFLPTNLDAYLTARREGRGSMPKVDKPLREQLLTEVIRPYNTWKDKQNGVDWNDLAVRVSAKKYYEYDIVVIDEGQDFAANQVRAVMKQLAAPHSVTFVLDTVQRIYARGFTWAEVGVTLRPENSYRLVVNYRNTKQIAALAASMLHELEIDDDGSIPDLKKCEREGALPKVLVGKYSDQMKYAIDYIRTKIDLSKESVAFLHPKGFSWFNTLKQGLTSAKLGFVQITRSSNWPEGVENIALSTLHSAKGLEFDHVIILGVNAEVIPSGELAFGDDRNTAARKLLAMGVTRAKKSVILGHKEDEASKLMGMFDRKTYKKVVL